MNQSEPAFTPRTAWAARYAIEMVRLGARGDPEAWLAIGEERFDSDQPDPGDPTAAARAHVERMGLPRGR